MEDTPKWLNVELFEFLLSMLFLLRVLLILFLSFQQKGIQIMEKQSASRTPDELEFLSDQLGDLQFFQEYVQDDMVDLLKRCVRYVKYQFCKKGEVIFRIGSLLVIVVVYFLSIIYGLKDSEADKFYIIISGLVGVFTRPLDSHQNKKHKKKKVFEDQINRQKDPLNTDQHNNQSVQSINQMSQIELQNVSNVKIENSKQRMSIASFCEDNLDDKYRSMKSISQYSSMKSINNLQIQQRSLSPMKNNSSQISIPPQNVQNRQKAQNTITSASRSLTIEAKEKKQKSISIQKQDEGFFLTQDQGQRNIIQNVSQEELQVKNEGNQFRKQSKKNQEQTKNEQDIIHKKSIYSYGEQLIKAKNMESGTAFGELALVYNKERAATIICLKDTHLAYIEKEHFIQIFSQKEERRIKLQAEYIGKLPLFSNFSFQFLRDLYYNTISHKCKNGEIIFSEGSSPENVYIVKKGEFTVQFQFFLNGKK